MDEGREGFEERERLEGRERLEERERLEKRERLEGRERLERIDLSPLDPDEDPQFRARVTDRAMAGVAAMRAGLTEPSFAEEEGIELALIRVAGVALAAAGIIVAACIAGAIYGGSVAAHAKNRASTVAEAAGIPTPMVAWIEAGRAPSPTELFSAMRGY